MDGPRSYRRLDGGETGPRDPKRPLGSSARAFRPCALASGRIAFACLSFAVGAFGVGVWVGFAAGLDRESELGGLSSFAGLDRAAALDGDFDVLVQGGAVLSGERGGDREVSVRRGCSGL